MATPKNQALDQLNWIEDNSMPTRPQIDEFPIVADRTFGNTVISKMGENMLVPVGLLATVTCLTAGLFSMRRGDPKRQQLFMRGRVGFQVGTFIAMAATIALTATKRTYPSDTTNETQKIAE